MQFKVQFSLCLSLFYPHAYPELSVSGTCLSIGGQFPNALQQLGCSTPRSTEHQLQPAEAWRSNPRPTCPVTSPDVPSDVFVPFFQFLLPESDHLGGRPELSRSAARGVPHRRAFYFQNRTVTGFGAQSPKLYCSKSKKVVCVHRHNVRISRFLKLKVYFAWQLWLVLFEY